MPQWLRFVPCSDRNAGPPQVVQQPDWRSVVDVTIGQPEYTGGALDKSGNFRGMADSVGRDNGAGRSHAHRHARRQARIALYRGQRHLSAECLRRRGGPGLEMGGPVDGLHGHRLRPCRQPSRPNTIPKDDKPCLCRMTDPWSKLHHVGPSDVRMDAHNGASAEP
jgi:hypothetical protein